MHVKISFDAEKESIEDLKKLMISIQDIINKREKAATLGNPLAIQAITKPSQIKIESQQVQPQENVVKGSTSGGCRVIPYEDMSGVLSKIVSGRKY